MMNTIKEVKLMFRSKSLHFLILVIVLPLLIVVSMACGSGSPSQSSEPPESSNSEEEELRTLAYNLYQAIGRQDLQTIVSLMDPTDVAFHENCQVLPQAFSGVTFELAGIDREEIPITIFSQTDADIANGIRRAWTEDFNATIRVNGGQWVDIQLGGDKFTNRGDGWYVAGFRVFEANIGMPYNYSCGRWRIDDWQ
jgi:hypothetical protein